MEHATSLLKPSSELTLPEIIKNKFCINPRSGLKNPRNSQLPHGKGGDIWHVQCPINYRRSIYLQITWFGPPIFSYGNFS